VDSFTIVVTDVDRHSAELTVNVTVNPVNDAPTDITFVLLAPSLAGIPENQTGVVVAIFPPPMSICRKTVISASRPSPLATAVSKSSAARR
jgi:hypothetical protein